MDVSLTLLLSRAQSGDRHAEGRALQLAYQKLKSIAGGLLRHERSGHTLQPTALVSEVFLRKLRRMTVEIRDREHFYSLAAYAMRQVLIDHARTRRATLPLTAESVAEMLSPGDGGVPAEDRLAVRHALDALRGIDPGAAAAIVARFAEGMTISQTAEHLAKPVWKIRDDSDFGLAWMAERLRQTPR